MSPYRKRVPEQMESWWGRIQEWYWLKQSAYRYRRQEKVRVHRFQQKYGFVLHCPSCTKFVDNDLEESKTVDAFGHTTIICKVTCRHCSSKYQLFLAEWCMWAGMPRFAEIPVPASTVVIREKAADEAALLVSEHGESLIAVVKPPKVFIPMFEMPPNYSCSFYETQLREAADQFGGILPVQHEGATYDGLMYVKTSQGSSYYGFLVLVKAEALDSLRPSQYPEDVQSSRTHLNTLERS